MPLLSDYLNFNGVPGTQGPQGFQGEPAASITVKGIDTWANIDAIAVPDVNDLWIMNEVTGAPDRWDAAPAQIGDAVVWDGAAWINVGPIQGPQGPQGFQGETGYGIQMKGSDTWANIALIVTPVINDVWIMTDVTGGAPAFGLEAAEIGDAVVWTGLEWENIGPIAGEDGVDGAQGPQGFQGSVGASIVIVGNDTWANISAIVTPAQNEAWFLTDATGAPLNPQGTANIGDIVVWSGTLWVNAGPIQGPQGVAGVDGLDGAQGAVGQTGAQGPQGDAGALGSSGPQGPQGETGDNGLDAGEFNKSITIEVPSSTENITFFYTAKAVTVSQLRTVLVGSGGPSLDFEIGFATDRTGIRTMIGSATVTDQLTGVDVPILEANIPAANWVWITTSAFLGTIDHVNMTLLGAVDTP